MGTETILLAEDDPSWQARFQKDVLRWVQQTRPMELVIAGSIEDAVSHFRELLEANVLNSTFLDYHLRLWGNRWGHEVYRLMLQVNAEVAAQKTAAWSLLPEEEVHQGYASANVSCPKHVLYKGLPSQAVQFILSHPAPGSEKEDI
ncbi:hypothetical protein HYZ99_00090 [Candidatus Peregrinibacteria bacterium]|nr:hypothetical protein [Candidatus Peregrinibacteria bacterium]